MNFSDPVQAFDAVIAALRARDWRGAAALCDAASARLVQRELLARFTTPIRRLTVEDLLAGDPDVPLEVAEYEVARHNSRVPDRAAQLAHDLPDVSDADALRALTPAAALAAWLEGQSDERQGDGSAIGERSAAEIASLRAASASRFDLLALGWVPEGDTIAHVLYAYATPTGEDAEAAGAEADAADDAAAAAVGMGALSDAERALLRRRRQWRPSLVACRRQPDGGWRLVASLDDFPGVSGILFAICTDGDGDGDVAAPTPTESA